MISTRLGYIFVSIPKTKEKQKKQLNIVITDIMKQNSFTIGIWFLILLFYLLTIKNIYSRNFSLSTFHPWENLVT